MIEEKDSSETFECSLCGNQVAKEDEFCPECGTLFEDGVKCSAHPEADAEGVCIICCLPCCSQCGGPVNKRFLCNEHTSYEIYQGMARIYGDLDATNIEYARHCLEEAGLHPFVFSKGQAKGGSRLVSTLFEANGDSYGHLVNEVKLMVPCQEVIAAEDVLKKLQIIV